MKEQYNSELIFSLAPEMHDTLIESLALIESIAQERHGQGDYQTWRRLHNLASDIETVLSKTVNAEG